MSAPPVYDHIVLVSIDTLRSDCIGATPSKLWPLKYPGLRAPNSDILDEIAANSAFFPNCISAAPYTAASHATYFTGRWPLRHCVYEVFNRRLSAPTVFTAARHADYATIFKTDFPIILGDFLGFDRDIDRYIVEDDDAFLDALAREERSVSFAHFGSVHVPFGFHSLRISGQRYVDKVAALEAELDLTDDLPKDILIETYRDDEDLKLMQRYKRIVQHYYGRGEYDRIFALYLEGVEFFLRHRFERFFNRLQALLKGKKYLLVIFGDHGEEYDEVSYGHHNSLAEGVIRVPLMFYGPDVAPGLRPWRVRTVDVAPTILACIGDNPSRRPRWTLDGESLGNAIWSGYNAESRPAIAQVYTAETTDYVRYQQRLVQTRRKSGALAHVLYQEAAYDGDWKLTRRQYRYREGGGIWGLERCDPVMTLEHFNGSLIPEAADDPGVHQRLIERLSAYNVSYRPQKRRQVTDEIRYKLRALGYRI